MIAARLPRRRRPPSPFALALAVVLLAALGLRLFGLNWDEGQDLHPDELFVARIVLVDRIDPGWPPDPATWLDPGTSPLNPRSDDPATGTPREFAYGALPLFVTDAAAGLLSLATGTDWNAADKAYLVGRVLSALLDAGTVLLVAAMAHRLAGPWAAVAAALVAALTPLMIQLAHFFTTDSWLTFFVALCLVLCQRALARGTAGSLALAGAAAGCAMATKGSVATLFGVVALTGLLQAAPHPGRGALATVPRIARGVLAAGAAAVAAFALFEPYALLRPEVYLQSLRTQADIVRGAFDVPFTRVFVGTTLADTFWQWFRWGYGPAAAVFALAGLWLLLRRVLADRGGPALPLLAWAGGYALVVAVAEVRFLRYLAPLTPVFAVAAGAALDRLRRWDGIAAWANGRRLAAAALAGVGLWAAAFAAVYAGEHPRLAASRWLYATVAPGSGITAEYWDDALPRDFGMALSPAAFRFATVPVDPYADLPPAEASASLFDALARADVLVLSSNRVEAATAAAPWRYPVQNALYRQLAEDGLGFSLADAWDDPPRLGPLRFDDRDADESFVNYDHPTVRIWTRDGPPERTVWDAAMAWAVAQPWSPTRHEPAPSLLLDRPVGELPVVDDARWSAAVTTNPVAASAAWIGLLLALHAAGLPLARLLLPAFADRGWGQARLLALLTAGFLVWFAASVGWLAFRAVWCWTALLLVGALGWGLATRRRVARSLLPQGPFERGAELAFWGVFGVFLLLRWLNPDGWHPIWGGEKPMEFAHLNATLRSAHFPPYDPWFSDGILNYYYYGLYLVAFAVKLTGIPSEVAFNLAQPTIMGLLASGLFSVGASLGRDLGRRAWAGLLAGGAAVGFGVLVGNLSSASALLSGQAARRDSFVDWVWSGSRAIDGAITEFPFFTGLYADLHAHVVALPITVLAIALAYSLAALGQSALGMPGAGPVLAGLALTLGSLSATNAWDVPTYAALAVAALWMATAGADGWARRVGWFAGSSLLLVAAAYALFLPFHARFVALFGSLAPVREPTLLREWAVHLGGLAAVSCLGLLAMTTRSRLFGRFALPRSAALLAPAGLVVVVGLALLAGGLGWAATAVAAAAAIVLLLGAWGALPERTDREERWVDRLPVLIGTAAAAWAFASGRVVLGLALAAFSLAGVGWLFARPTAARFACLLAAAAWGVVTGVELVVVADDLIGTPAYRMNTIFKFYNQVWILLSLAAASGLAAAAVRLATRRRTAPKGLRWQAAAATVATAGVVLLAGAVYPVLATPPRLAQRFPEPPPLGTLSALDWMDRAALPSLGYAGREIAFAGDRAAIDWFNRAVPGSPVVAEASIGPYRCNGSRISIGTGLPTILGWERHQQQQRPLAQLAGRAADVERLYHSTDPVEKEAILRRYRVAYVVVGDLERAYPVASNDCEATNPAAGIETLEGMVGSVLEVAFAQGGTTVYRVLPPATVAHGEPATRGTAEPRPIGAARS